VALVKDLDRGNFGKHRIPLAKGGCCGCRWLSVPHFVAGVLSRCGVPELEVAVQGLFSTHANHDCVAVQAVLKSWRAP
jgi:hypothetical protein